MRVVERRRRVWQTDQIEEHRVALKVRRMLQSLLETWMACEYVEGEAGVQGVQATTQRKQ